MKNITFIILLLCSLGYSQSDNIDTNFGNVGYVSGTLTTAIDTMDVVPAGNISRPFAFITAVAVSSDVDTVQVWTLARDGSTWSQKSVIDLNSGSTVATMILSTTAKEFIVNDPQPLKVRFISTSNDGSTSTVVVQGKYGVR